MAVFTQVPEADAGALVRQLALGELASLSFAGSTDDGDVDASETGTSTSAGDAWLEAILAEKLPLVEAREKVLATFERRYVEYMLEASGGNVARAAAHAGVARRYFQILKARRK